MGEQFGDGRFVQEFPWDPSDQDGVGLGAGGMGGVDEMGLAENDKFTHFGFDVVQDPAGEEPDEDDVGCVAGRVDGVDVSKGELVETGEVVGGSGGSEGHEDGPGEDPDWKEDTCHHTQEAYKEVSVHAIVVDNVTVVCAPDVDEPSKETSAERLLPFTVMNTKS